MCYKIEDEYARITYHLPLITYHPTNPTNPIHAIDAIDAIDAINAMNLRPKGWTLD